jgi:hypothetical protein
MKFLSLKEVQAKISGEPLTRAELAQARTQARNSTAASLPLCHLRSGARVDIMYWRGVNASARRPRFYYLARGYAPGGSKDPFKHG